MITVYVTYGRRAVGKLRPITKIQLSGHTDDHAVCACVTGVVAVARQLLGGTDMPEGGGAYEVVVGPDELSQYAADGIAAALHGIDRDAPGNVVVSEVHR